MLYKKKAAKKNIKTETQYLAKLKSNVLFIIPVNKDMINIGISPFKGLSKDSFKYLPYSIMPKPNSA